MTIKQRKFIKGYLQNGGNGTQAALEAYNVSDPNVAKVIASENLTKPNVKREIELALEAKGLSDEYISELLREATVAGIGQKATNSDSLRGIEMMLKLKDAFPSKMQKSAHLRIDYRQEIEQMSMKDLMEELIRTQKMTAEMLKDL